MSREEAPCSGVIDREDLEPLAAFLGRTPSGDAVPPCWHWCQLLGPVDPRRLNEDGYLIGGMVTPEPGKTRMFAGGRVRTKVPLRLGVRATRSTRVAAVSVKKGRHGPLRFVTLESVWSQSGRTMLVDEQDYVFTTAQRSTAAPSDASEPGSPPPALGPGQIAVTEPMLVLFSGLTANPYRIHWDRDFCARAGHPGLVIHGPLQALWLAEEFIRRGTDLNGRTFSYRLTAPATAPAVMSVGEGAGDPGAELVVRRPDGVITATASLG